MSRRRRVVAEFADFGAFIGALKSLRELEFRDFSVFSPVELDDYEELMPRRGSPIPWIALGTGFVGAFLGFLLAAGSASLYKLMVGGKPWENWVVYCVVGFEAIILTTALVTVNAIFGFSRLWPRRVRDDYSEHFSADSFGITAQCGSGDCDDIIELLQTAGASEIREF